MVFKNTPPGKQRIYSLPTARPEYVNTQGFNTNGFVIRQAIIGSQLSSSSSLVARNNVATQTGGKSFHN